MSMFDDVLKKGKKIAGQVGKGASQAADFTKLNVSKGEVKNNIKKSYETLGENIYNCVKNDEDYSAIIAEAVAEITSLKEKLEQIDDELLLVQNKIKCPHCGTVNPKTASFCSKCGAKIPEENVEEADAEPVK